MSVYIQGVIEPLAADTPRIQAVSGGTDSVRLGVAEGIVASEWEDGIVLGMIESASVQETLP